MTVTLAITNFNRYEMLIESFQNVINDDRISEILIMDDHSDDHIYFAVEKFVREVPKIKVIRQPYNKGMSANKHDAIALSSNEWVIIFDSDNIIDSSYLDAFIPSPLQPDCFYLPSFAKPEFDYRNFSGFFFNKKTIRSLRLPTGQPRGVGRQRGVCITEIPMFWTMLNTCNMLVHRDTYCRVYEENPKAGQADTIWMNYLWLKAGNSMMVLSGMEYEHRVHPASGFLQNVAANMKKAEEIKQLILSL